MTQFCKGCSCGVGIKDTRWNWIKGYSKEPLLRGRISFEGCKKACLDEPGCHGFQHGIEDWQPDGATKEDQCYKCYDVENPDFRAEDYGYSNPTVVYKLGILTNISFFISNFLLNMI